MAFNMDLIDKNCIEALEINPKDIYLTTTELLLKIIDNVLDKPTLEMYRKLRVTNPIIKSKLLNAIGAKQCLIKIGFIEEKDSLILPQYVTLESLKKYRDFIASRRSSYMSQIDSSDEFQTSAPSSSKPQDNNLCQLNNIDKSVSTVTKKGFIKENQLMKIDLPKRESVDISGVKNNEQLPIVNRSSLEIETQEGKVPEVVLEKKITVKEAPNDIVSREIPIQKASTSCPLVPTENCLKTSNPFLLNIEKYFNSVLRYEDKALQEKALACIPLAKLQVQAQEQLRKLQRAIKQGVTQEQEPDMDELVLLALLQWFKEDFFSWVDTPKCNNCGKKTTFSQMYHSEGDKIEVYRCEYCATLINFPRYNDPEQLLITRRGRCGEWANCFTLLCRAMGWDTRYVVDQADHVWTEVYSHSQKRWLHCDSCENICDSPLIYESGWGKKPTYIMAYNSEDLQDVTWRYTAYHKDTLKRRTLCTERELLDTIERLRLHRQSKLSDVRKKYLAKRAAMELVELMIERTSNSSDSQGRSSGSLSWRLARGETNLESSKTRDPYVWLLDKYQGVIDSKQFILRYSAAKDEYEALSKNGCVLEIMPGWMNGAFKIENIFRKEEKDWKVVYLARRENFEVGSLSWKFDTGNSGLFIDSLSITFDTKTYENGKITSEMCNDNTCFLLPIDELPRKKNEFKGSKSLELKVRLKGGRGNLAWQHAQLFRQPLNCKNYPFQIIINLKEQ